MNTQSGVFRVVCGLALAGMAAYVYSSLKPDAEDSRQQGATLFGHQLSMSADLLLFIVAAIGIAGLLFAVFGLIQALRSK